MTVDQPRIAAAANLPANAKRDLVTVRNNAIHQNHVPNHQETIDALRLAQQIVSRLDALPV
jgi:hypothetical protein